MSEMSPAEMLNQVPQPMPRLEPHTEKTDETPKVSGIPTFTVIDRLPSKCLSYPENVEIAYRPYSFGEAKKLSQSKFSMKEHIDFVLSGVQTQGLKSKYDITYSDFLFISLLRRIATVQTQTVSITFPCQHCESPNTYQINVSDLEFQDIEIPKLPMIVNIKGKELRFSFFTIGNFIEAQKKNNLKDNMALLAYSVTNMPYREAYSIITDNNLSFEDGSVLDVVEAQLYHGLKTKEFVCQKGDCGQTSKVNLEILNMVISPFRENEDSYRDRIRYGD